MKKTICNIFNNTPAFCLGSFSLYIFFTLFVNVIFDNKILNNYTEIYNKTPNFLIIIASVSLVAVSLFLLLFPLNNKIKLSNKKFVLLICLCFAVIFAVQLFITSNIWFYTGWDVETIVYDAKNIAQNGANSLTAWYYSTYPNNIVPAYLLVLILKIGKLFFDEPYLAVLVANCLLVCVSLMLAVLCVFKLTHSRRVTVLGMLAGVCLIALSPWIVIPYTDTLGMIFPVLCIFLYLYIKNRCLKYLLCSFSATLGYLLKPTVIIVLIALFIVELCGAIANAAKGKFEYKSVIALALSVLAALLFAIGIKQVVLFADKTEFNKSIEFSMEHYFMMGTNRSSNGGYSSEDVSLSYSFEGTANRKKNNLDVAFTRIKEMGPSEYAKHLVCKNLFTYNDGTFYWGKEGRFFNETFEKEGTVPKALKSLYYTDGKNFAKFCTAEQIIWFFVLICICFCLLPKKSAGEILIGISLIGVSLFLLIFEARSRYLFIFSPLYVTLACIGLHKLSVFTNNFIKRRKSK